MELSLTCIWVISSIHSFGFLIQGTVLAAISTRHMGHRTLAMHRQWWRHSDRVVVDSVVAGKFLSVSPSCMTLFGYIVIVPKTLLVALISHAPPPTLPPKTALSLSADYQVCGLLLLYFLSFCFVCILLSDTSHNQPIRLPVSETCRWSTSDAS